MNEQSEVDRLSDELRRLNRDIGDAYLGEGAGAHLSGAELKELEARRDALEERLREMGVEVPE